MWDQATVLSEEWIYNIYEPVYLDKKKARIGQQVERIRTYTLKPNSMQKEAFKALDKLRREQQEKAILISATGTGKTYLSAFDVRNFQPKKMLFLVHREQFLKQAIESFSDVLGNDIYAGLLSGTRHDYDADYLFSKIQTMSNVSTMGDRSYNKDTIRKYVAEGNSVIPGC